MTLICIEKPHQLSFVARNGKNIKVWLSLRASIVGKLNAVSNWRHFSLYFDGKSLKFHRLNVTWDYFGDERTFQAEIKLVSNSVSIAEWPWLLLVAKSMFLSKQNNEENKQNLNKARCFKISQVYSLVCTLVIGRLIFFGAFWTFQKVHAKIFDLLNNGIVHGSRSFSITFCRPERRILKQNIQNLLYFAKTNMFQSFHASISPVNRSRALKRRKVM